ncbi:MAG: ECF transporter S component, partial [Chloroflexota bacterium]
TNTCLVLGMGVLRGYLPNLETAAAIGVTHGIPEVVVAVIVVLAIVLPWKRAQRGGGGARLRS